MQMQEPIPVAMAVPVDAQPPVATAIPVAPQHRGTGGPQMVDMNNFWKRLSRPQKMCVIFSVLVTVVAGGFFFVRIVIMGCGCPEEYGYGRRLQHGSHEDTCMCTGDVFSCEWNCGGQCYSGGKAGTCGSPGGGGTGGGPGTVTCACDSNYCACGSDCSTSYCGCSEAQASGCCGSGR